MDSIYSLRLYTFVTVLLLIFNAPSIQGQGEKKPIQTLRLHGSERCDDIGETFTDNIRNLALASRFVFTKTLRCACVDFGVWSYSSRINFYGGDFGGSHIAVTKVQAEKTCLTFGSNSTILSIRKVGNSNVDVPAMSLFIEASLRGRELYFDGKFLQLPWPILFRSVGFTGLNASWAIYKTPEVSGDYVCMGQRENTLITYSSGSKYNLVGSVVRDACAYGSPDAADQTANTISHGPSVSLNLRDRSKQLVTDSHELRLPYPITVYSYSLSGYQNWTLYRGILFNGRSICIYSTEGEEESGPLNFVDEVEGFPVGSIVVGSIRQGCNHVRINSSGNIVDYVTDNDDIYDYEDGYGFNAYTSHQPSATYLTSRIGLICTQCLLILTVFISRSYLTTIISLGF